MAKAAAAGGQATAEPAADTTTTTGQTAATEGTTAEGTTAAGADDGDGQAAAEPAGGKTKPKGKVKPTSEGTAAGDGAQGAPEKYELTVPEGAEAYLDADDLKHIEAVARAKGWTNEVAQEAIEEHADALAAQSAAFRSQTEKDSTYGGEHLAETQRLVATVLDKFAPDDDPLGKALRRDLARSGYGNKLSVVSLLARIGKAMSEDQPGLTTTAGGVKGKKRTPEEVFYGETVDAKT
jgi:hypothetical protein